MNTLQKFEARQLAQLKAGKTLAVFSPGDTVVVNVKIKEGERERIQAYEGICIAKSGAGVNESFTVRKISYGEGVERVFPLNSPSIDSIDIVRRGSVRRAKLYYLRDRKGKSARIAERTSGHGFDEEGIDTAAVEAAEIKKSKAKVKKEKPTEAKAKKPAKK